VDAGTTGYQRVLGGILIPTLALFIFKWRSAHTHGGWLEKKLWPCRERSGDASGRGFSPTRWPARHSA
jgi:hypothetical protein